jgi:hypothetical protein
MASCFWAAFTVFGLGASDGGFFDEFEVDELFDACEDAERARLFFLPGLGRDLRHLFVLVAFFRFATSSDTCFLMLSLISSQIVHLNVSVFN